MYHTRTVVTILNTLVMDCYSSRSVEAYYLQQGPVRSCAVRYSWNANLYLYSYQASWSVDPAVLHSKCVYVHLYRHHNTIGKTKAVFAVLFPWKSLVSILYLCPPCHKMFTPFLPNTVKTTEGAGWWPPTMWIIDRTIACLQDRKFQHHLKNAHGSMCCSKLYIH